MPFALMRIFVFRRNVNKLKRLLTDFTYSDNIYSKNIYRNDIYGNDIKFDKVKQA